MKTRILTLILAVAACAVFFSAKAASAQGPSFGLTIPGRVSVQIGPSYGNPYGPGCVHHHPPVVVVPPYRPYPPFGPIYGPPPHHHRPNGGYYRR